MQLRNDPEGLSLPSNTFRSYAAVQGGGLTVDFSESHFWKLGAAKQQVIDRIASRLQQP